MFNFNDIYNIIQSLINIETDSITCKPICTQTLRLIGYWSGC